MNLSLLHKKVQDFVEENYREELSTLIFQGSPFEGVTVQDLATQLTGKRKAEKKLPTWFNTRGIVYPPSLNLEQTSSEVTAEYKAALVSGNTLVDLTGGFGIDSYFFASKMEKVIHCELNPELSELVTHNSKFLGASNIETYAGDGLEYLRKAEETFDWIYIDPSRRDDAGGRVFRLSDCLPDVPLQLDFMFEKAVKVMVKTSPLLDLHSGALDLQKVQEVHIIAVNNEVKELLWLLEDRGTELKDIELHTINFTKKGRQIYGNHFLKEAEVTYGLPKKYLYEPNASIMKSGLFDAVSEDFAIEKLHRNTHLYTSESLVDFPGRRFEINNVLPYSPKKLKRELKLTSANISTRNFPESVAILRKQFKLKDGGEDYLFFTTVGKDQRVVLQCRKV